jgi:pentapeptide MXKDX repeat protein
VASGKNEISKRVDESLVAELGRVPSTYASSAYDAVWIVGLAMDREQSTDVALLRQAIPEIAAEHTGALGSTLLNDYGDLAQTNYDVWDIRDGVWTVAGTYFASSDTIKHDDGTVDDEMKDDGMVDDEMKDDGMVDDEMKDETLTSTWQTRARPGRSAPPSRTRRHRPRSHLKSCRRCTPRT